MARAGDTVLLAGKGHETYQEARGVRNPFDDRAVAREVLEGYGYKPGAGGRGPGEASGPTAGPS